MSEEDKLNNEIVLINNNYIYLGFRSPATRRRALETRTARLFLVIRRLLWKFANLNHFTAHRPRCATRAGHWTMRSS